VIGSGLGYHHRVGRPRHFISWSSIGWPSFRWSSFGWAGALLVLAAGCGGDPPLRDCFARVWVPASEGGAVVLGSWDGWRKPGIPALPHDPDWLLARFSPGAGEHGYLIDTGTGQRRDPYNPLTTYRGEEEVSLLPMADCSVPAVVFDEVSMSAEGTLTLRGTFLAAAAGDELDIESVSARTTDGVVLPIESVDDETGQLVVRAAGATPGRHAVIVTATDVEGRGAEAARAVTWRSPRAASWGDGVIYQVMIDRFAGDGGVALDPPETPGRRAGGTLGGVTAAIEGGTFDELGVTALWLSPAYVNPDGQHLGNDGRLYEGYHGYWPLDSRAVDPRIGGEEALDRLMGAAHSRGMAVLLDVVPNHVYETNPRYLDHRDDGWFYPEGCVCGASDCPWSSHIETCWFTPYLPDVRWQNAAAMRAVVDDVLWWTRRFNLDGLRIDAIPMMPRAVTRRLAYELRRATYPQSATFLLGEVFTGPGVGALPYLQYYLGPSGLDSVFDFPLMWALHGAIATSSAGFGTVEAILAAEDVDMAGSGAVLARILDNHDTPRFLSVAHGDGSGDPWDSPAVQPLEPEPYQRLELALAVQFTLPGVPVLFQGDEIGLAGASDPDCRRVMPPDDQLSDHQLAVRDTTKRLAKLRACSVALRRGDRRAAVTAGDLYAYLRGRQLDHPAIVLLTTSQGPTAIELPPASVPAGDYVDVTTASSFTVVNGAATTVPLEGLSFRILLRADDPCRGVYE
jgi:glycosidase